MAAKGFTIGHLSRQTGAKVETIRFYEKAGLLPAPARSDANYRSYESGHVNRLSFIRRARSLGFSIDQIRTLLSLSDDRTKSCAAIDGIAKEHLEDIERKITDLNSLRRELNRMVDQCGCGTVADCRIIEALSGARDILVEDRT